MIQTRFKKKIKIIDIVITAVAGMLAVGDMLYGIHTYGLKEIWLEPVLDVFYIACLIMIWMYFFNKLETNQFNYWWHSMCGHHRSVARYSHSTRIV